MKNIKLILIITLCVLNNISAKILDPPIKIYKSKVDGLDYTQDELLRAINLSYCPGVSYLYGVGLKAHNAFNLKFQMKEHWNYLFLKFNYLNNLKNNSPDAFSVINYKQYSPIHNYNNFSIGYGNYLFSKLHDNVNYHIDVSIGFSSSKITIADSIYDSGFTSYGIGIGTSQKITKQLRMGYSFNVFAPFSSEFLSRKEAIIQKSFSNLVYNFEFSLQFMFFEKND